MQTPKLIANKETHNLVYSTGKLLSHMTLTLFMHVWDSIKTIYDNDIISTKWLESQP